jgi:hypothetical protein
MNQADNNDMLSRISNTETDWFPLKTRDLEAAIHSPDFLWNK